MPRNVKKQTQEITELEQNLEDTNIDSKSIEELSGELENKVDDGLEDELEISKKIYYLNKVPKACESNPEELPVIYWAKLKPEDLHHVSMNLDNCPNDRKILSDFYDVRFFSLRRLAVNGEDEREYLQVQVDKDFILWRIARLFQDFTDTEEESTALFSESLTVMERLKTIQLEAELEKLMKQHGLSTEDLKKVLKNDK